MWRARRCRRLSRMTQRVGTGSPSRTRISRSPAISGRSPIALNGNTPRKFQEAAAGSQSPVTYVKAGCGTGKTVAAYLWAAANHPTRRFYSCYPTTGTATEGFKDYLFEPDGELG